jgi:hypothetical protein
MKTNLCNTCSYREPRGEFYRHAAVADDEGDASASREGEPAVTELFRRGDVVSVRCIVQIDQASPEYVHLSPRSSDHQLIYVPAPDVELIHHGFNVGDAVTFMMPSGVRRDGVVKAIDGAVAWVRTQLTKNTEPVFSTIDLADLKPAGGVPRGLSG